MNIQYYQQTPIMRRILDHVDNSVYILGTSPDQPSSQFKRYNDIMNAMGEGSDIYRSQMDFGGVIFFIDIEYGNMTHPGEIFHRPQETFEKIEPLRKAIKDSLENKGLSHLELMTGQGYNYATKINRDSASYKALVETGKKLRVMPWTSALKLIEKERKHGNMPLLKDSLAFGALGRITEYLYDTIRNEYTQLPMVESDLFDNNEIAIFDTTQYGYLLNNRLNRIAFSLHQKSQKKPELAYFGPPISTIPPSGLSLESRISIRSDNTDNYHKAAELAREANTRIPESDISFLLSSYLMSDHYKKHSSDNEMLEPKILNDEEQDIIGRLYPDIEVVGTFWNTPQNPDWNMINSAPISHHARRVIDHPNDLLLKPWDIRHLILELDSHDVPKEQIISLISYKYGEKHHNWNVDLNRNNPEQRAEYWVRTFLK